MCVYTFSTKMFMFHVLIIRNVQRVIHVPFYTPVMTSTDGEQLMLEERMSVTR